MLPWSWTLVVQDGYFDGKGGLGGVYPLVVFLFSKNIH